jgi:hypothetical protein
VYITASTVWTECNSKYHLLTHIIILPHKEIVQFVVLLRQVFPGIRYRELINYRAVLLFYDSFSRIDLLCRGIEHTPISAKSEKHNFSCLPCLSSLSKFFVLEGGWFIGTLQPSSLFLGEMNRYLKKKCTLYCPINALHKTLRRISSSSEGNWTENMLGHF